MSAQRAAVACAVADLSTRSARATPTAIATRTSLRQASASMPLLKLPIYPCQWPRGHMKWVYRRAPFVLRITDKKIRKLLPRQTRRNLVSAACGTKFKMVQRTLQYRAFDKHHKWKSAWASILVKATNMGHNLDIYLHYVDSHLVENRDRLLDQAR